MRAQCLLMRHPLFLQIEWEQLMEEEQASMTPLEREQEEGEGEVGGDETPPLPPAPRVGKMDMSRSAQTGDVATASQSPGGRAKAVVKPRGKRAPKVL